MKVFTSLFITFLLSACHTTPQNEEVVPQKVNAIPTHKVSITALMQKQLLLTNDAAFSKDRWLHGASAFLMHYNNSIYAVTAKHLIGPDGGVEPEVALNQLPYELVQWKMYPSVPVHPATDTITASAKGLDYSASTSDALLLKTVDLKTDILALYPAFDIPAQGDSLYIIGCPYSEADCKQNLYKMVFYGLEDNMLISEIFSEVDMSGFSGAPIVNTSGEVVGILKGSGAVDGKFYAIATPISEIKKVR